MPRSIDAGKLHKGAFTAGSAARAQREGTQGSCFPADHRHFLPRSLFLLLSCLPVILLLLCLLPLTLALALALALPRSLRGIRSLLLMRSQGCPTSHLLVTSLPSAAKLPVFELRKPPIQALGSTVDKRPSQICILQDY